MKNLKTKTVVIMLITLAFLALISTNVFASELEVQIVKADSTYVIYVKGMLNKEFKFAVSDTDVDGNSLELSYMNSIADGEGNNVALLNAESKYLYIKTSSDISKVELDFEKAVTVEQIEIAESVTDIIPTKAISIEKRNEEIDGVKYEETAGALQIDEEASGRASYGYAMEKLPNEKFDALKEKMDELSNKYNDADMYEKIELAKNFVSEFDKVVANAEYSNVENMVIEQPEDAGNDEVYLVLLKKVDGDKTVYDVKVLNSEMTESKPEITKVTNVVKRTAKLPITGESLVLFGVLFVIIVAIVIVTIRMKKLGKESKH